jgi:hypothetical protein
MAEDLSQNKPDDKPESLKRVRKETEAQKQAFDLYYGMGEKRSLEAVAAGCGRSTRTIGEWSRRFGWKDRVVQREIEDAANQGSVANSVIDAKAEYRKIIRALIAGFVKDYKAGKVRIKNITDFERVVKLDLMLLGEVAQLEVKSDVALSEEDRKAIFAVADSIKAEMDALRG